MSDDVKCGRCKRFLPKNAFTIHRQRKNGLNFYCKKCNNKMRRLKAKQNAPRVNQLRRERRATDPVHRDFLNAQVRGRRGTPKFKFSQLKAKAKKRGLSLEITLDDYEAIIASGACTYCRDPLPESGYGIDRKSSGVGYTKENCVPCCAPCNQIRGADAISHEEMYEVMRLLKRLRSPSTPVFADGPDVAFPAIGPASPREVVAL